MIAWFDGNNLNMVKFCMSPHHYWKQAFILIVCVCLNPKLYLLK